MSGEQRDTRTWRIGELAAIAGVTVRTLHHYEQVGLIAPVEREEGAHRLYNAAAVEQLYRIRALCSFGLSLQEIQSMREDGVSLEALLQRHLARVDAEIAQQMRLRDRLRQLVGLAASAEPESLLATLEAMALLERTARQRFSSGSLGASETIATWNTLRDKLRTCMDRQADPADEAVCPLAHEARDLIVAFTGGDHAMQVAMLQVRRAAPPQDFAGWDPPLFRYLDRALAALPTEEAHE